MICRACDICEDEGGGEPLGVTAVKTTRTPPTRSMPSFGLCRAPGHTTTAYRTAKIPRRARK
jgi:hypothetical protein